MKYLGEISHGQWSTFLEETENNGLKTVGGLTNGDKRRGTIS